jgi:Tol biopolymer transport system component
MKQLRMWLVAGVVVAAGLSSGVAVNGQTPSPGVQLKAAQYRADVQGDWTGAIAEFKRLSSDQDRTVAAQAMLALADAYEKTGAGSATAVLTQIVKQFADQPEVVTRATRRLKGNVGTGQDLIPRLSFSSETAQVMSVSADGSLAAGISFQPKAEVWLRNMSTGESRVLEAATDAGQPAPTVHLSRDGRFVAYTWVPRTATGQLMGDRRVIKTVATAPGATPKVISAPGTELFGFASGADTVLAFTRTASLRTLSALTLANQSSRVIRTFSNYAGDFTASPDGAWIAYASLTPDRHIHVMSGDGKTDTAVVQWSGNNDEPMWSADGRYLLFRSNRTGTSALYAVGVQQGFATGEPVLIQSAFTGNLIGLTTAGTLYTVRDEYDQMTLIAQRTGTGANVIRTLTGSAPAISPDGRKVVVNVKEGELLVRSVDTGAEKSYSHPGIGFGTGGQYLHNRWLPDGSGLVCWIAEPGGGSFYSLDLTSGIFTRRIARVTSERTLSAATSVSADGKNVLALLTREGASSWSHLATVELATGNLRTQVPLTGINIPATASIFSMAVSPDDRAVAVQYAVGGTTTLVIAAVDISTGAGRELTSYPTPGGMPDRLAWSPDGRSVLFSDKYDGTWKLMRIGSTGGVPQRDGIELSTLTGPAILSKLNPRSGDFGGASRDGSRLAFSMFTKSRIELWALDNVLASLNARR